MTAQFGAGAAPATHMPNESVVESMGKMVADHGDVARGLELENYAEEAIVHWNAPPLAQSKGFVTAALKRHFKKKDWRTAFTHASDRDRSGTKRKVSGLSKCSS